MPSAMYLFTHSVLSIALQMTSVSSPTIPLISKSTMQTIEEGCAPGRLGARGSGGYGRGAMGTTAM